MIQSEFMRIIKSTKGKVISVIIILLPLIDIMFNWYEDFTGYDGYENLIYEGLSHPSYASFLSGSSQGHIAQILMIWILPIYFLIAYSDSGVTDYKTGYKNFVFLRTSKKIYYKTKLIVSFIFPVIITLISLTINFIICNIIFQTGKSFNGMEVDADSNGMLFKISYHNPIVSYIGYILIFALISGLVSVLAQSIALISKNTFITYPIVFFVWFLQIISKYSITYTIQPFIEYGINYFIIGLAICIVITLIPLIILYFVRIKADEI